MIIGAGYSGLIAAHIFPQEDIMESSPSASESHKAVLRFRSDVVSRLVGIDFKAVTVRKGIYMDDGFHSPNIKLANMYSRKCLDTMVGDRSIWNVEPAVRYIAPESLYERLIHTLKRRITFGAEVDYRDVGTADIPYAISTAPMPSVLKELGITTVSEFGYKQIVVRRFRIMGRCELYQTVYFPTDYHTLYRASVTGDMLICEFAGAPAGNWEDDSLAAFGFRDAESLDSAVQRFGKIETINNVERKSLIYQLTTRHGIYSLGRFAVWRNILLDDVVEDASIIKKLLTASVYEHRLASI